MITKKQAGEAVEQIGRSGLSFPPNEDGAAALIDMLTQYARSPEHAYAVVSEWIQANPEWPKPSHLHDLCIEVADPAIEIAADRRGKCRYCHGDGFISADAQFWLSGAVRCTHGPEMADVTHTNLRIPASLRTHYADEQRITAPLRE
jgi:hypothetical protein